MKNNDLGGDWVDMLIFNIIIILGGGYEEHQKE